MQIQALPIINSRDLFEDCPRAWDQWWNWADNLETSGFTPDKYLVESGRFLDIMTMVQNSVMNDNTCNEIGLVKDRLASLPKGVFINVEGI